MAQENYREDVRKQFEALSARCATLERRLTLHEQSNHKLINTCFRALRATAILRRIALLQSGWLEEARAKSRILRWLFKGFRLALTSEDFDAMMPVVEAEFKEHAQAKAAKDGPPAPPPPSAQQLSAFEKQLSE